MGAGAMPTPTAMFYALWLTRIALRMKRKPTVKIAQPSANVLMGLLVMRVQTLDIAAVTVGVASDNRLDTEGSPSAAKADAQSIEVRTAQSVSIRYAQPAKIDFRVFFFLLLLHVLAAKPTDIELVHFFPPSFDIPVGTM